MISSVEEDSHLYSDKYRATFWKLGKELLNKAHVGTIFDKAQKLYEPQQQEDNFDLMHVTSEKMNTLRPIIKPEVYNPLLSVMGKRAAPILGEMANALYPTNMNECGNDVDLNNAKIAEEVPGWTKEFMQAETGTAH